MWQAKNKMLPAWNELIRNISLSVWHVLQGMKQQTVNLKLSERIHTNLQWPSYRNVYIFNICGDMYL